jgi:hypothetical protein
MVPRLHRRGNSFKGACNYILHDPGKASSERVAWVDTQNIYSHPGDAWFEMFDTYRNRAALKANAGIDPRGRDNKTPVLHYTLAWHANDNPDEAHMRAMALDSLKALGLSDHEAVIACHSDKEHHHVHVVVNTVHPYTGKTAPMKFSKLEFSKWAEAYEKEHGVRCEQREKNNERRREIAKDRKGEHALSALAALTGKEPPEPKPYEPVNDNSPNRRQWFERKEIVEKMQALRATLDQDQKLERGETWTRQRRERDQIDSDTRKALDGVRDHVGGEFKAQWRDLYGAQKREARELSHVATHPLERAVFVFRNRGRLGPDGKPLSIRQMVPLIVSSRKLNDRVLKLHGRERQALARREKQATKLHAEKIWQSHREVFHAVRDRQAAERAAERAHHATERKEVTFARAKAELVREQGQPAAEQRRPAREMPGVPAAPQGQGRTEVTRGRKTGNETATKTPAALLREAQVPNGVPVAPARPSRDTDHVARGNDHRAKSLLMPHAPGVPGVPVVNRTPEPPRQSVVSPAKESSGRQSAAELLSRQGKVPLPVPRALDPKLAPEAAIARPHATLPLADNTQKSADRGAEETPRAAGPGSEFRLKKADASKPFKNAVSPRAPDVKREFNDAATQSEKTAREDQEQDQRMRKELEEWQRRRLRDTFERER